LAVDANNKIIFVHSFKNLGGMILKPINRFAGFIGNGRLALAIVVDDSSLLARVDLTYQCPRVHPSLLALTRQKSKYWLTLPKMLP
jgi:hypothetical protein